MIKRDENGSVVEFEDESAVAARGAASLPKSDRPLKDSLNPGSGATREDLEQIFISELEDITAWGKSALTAFTSEATAKVAQIEKDCSIAKDELRKALQVGINETNRICRDAIASLKEDHKVALAEVSKSRYAALSPLQVAYDLKVAEVKANQTTEVAAARVRLSERLSHLKSEQASDDKLAAVVAEVPQSPPNPNETLDL